MCSKSASTSDRGDARACWLVRDGVVLASVEVPETRRARARGLLGRSSHDGAMLIRHTRSVHTIGMRFPIDVALIDADGVVLKTLTMRRNRISAPMIRARSVLEAEAGAFGSWGLKIGDVLEFRHADHAEPS